LPNKKRNLKNSLGMELQIFLMRTKDKRVEKMAGMPHQKCLLLPMELEDGLITALIVVYSQNNYVLISVDYLEKTIQKVLRIF